MRDKFIGRTAGRMSKIREMANCDYMIKSIRRYINREGVQEKDIRLKVMPIILNTASNVIHKFRGIELEIIDLINHGVVKFCEALKTGRLDPDNKWFLFRTKLFLSNHMVEECLSKGYVVHYPYGQRKNRSLRKFAYPIDPALEPMMCIVDDEVLKDGLLDRRNILPNASAGCTFTTKSDEDSVVNKLTVQRLLEGIPDKYKYIYDMYYVKEYTYKKIGKALNLSIEGVKKRHFKLIELLQEKVKHYESKKRISSCREQSSTLQKSTRK
jgi:RNA polymerase sigma factor (sigma-70 family)